MSINKQLIFYCIAVFCSVTVMQSTKPSDSICGRSSESTFRAQGTPVVLIAAGLPGCFYRAGPFVVLIAQGVPGCSYRAGLPGRSYRAGALVALIAQGSLVVLIAQCFRHWFSSDVPRGSGTFSIDPSIAIMIGVLNNKRPLIRSSKAFRTKMNKNE